MEKGERFFTIPISNLKNLFSRLISSRIFTKVCQAICQSQKYRSIGLLNRNFNSTLPFLSNNQPITPSHKLFSSFHTPLHTHYCPIISISRVQKFLKISITKIFTHFHTLKKKKKKNTKQKKKKNYKISQLVSDPIFHLERAKRSFHFR